VDRRRTSIAAFVVAGLAVAVLLVVFVAPHADSNPDGLAKVAADEGIDRGERASAVDGSPLAGYGVKGVDHEGVGKVVAGLVGIAVTFAVVLVLLWLVRRRRARETPEPVAG
jgi:hypothetical protein